MRLLVLDGANSIGGTKIYLEEKDVGVLLDFGINYGRWGLYFEEYLKPRAGRGIYDLWSLDLVPRVKGLYREDLFPQDLKPTYVHALNIQAVFLSHAHLDHCGLVGLVRGDLPLYSSGVSAAIMKAMQDSGRLDFHGEMAYWNLRAPKGEEPRGLEVKGGEPYRGRQLFNVLGDVPEKLGRFWRTPPNPKALEPRSRAKSLEAAPLDPSTDKVGAISFQAFPVDHSIPGAAAFAFETTKGLVIYTGDIRLHGKQVEDTRKMVAAVAKAKPYMLIVEGTRVGHESFENTTEQQVLENAIGIVKAAKGRLVIADFGARHVERLETFLAVSRETGRDLLVSTKDGYLLEAIAHADPGFKLLEDPALAIFDELRLNVKGWEETFRERHRDRLTGPDMVQKDPGRYILAFSFYDMNDLLDINPQGGVYIYSSSEAYGEDQRVDLWRLWNWIQFCQMEAHGLRWKGGNQYGSPEFPGRLHASGHIGANDLAWLIKEIKPQHVLPVHTENRNWFVESLKREPIRVVLTNNGEWFQPPS